MFGFVIGIACLWGLIRVVRGRGSCGGGGRWSRRGRFGGFDDEGWGDRWGGSPRRGFWLRPLFERLDTSPGQEREIQHAVEEVIDAARALKDDVRGSRREVAEALRGDDFNEELMASLLSRHDERIDALRRSAVGSLARVHATLEPDQRKQLARWLERGPGFGGPYRGAHR